MLTNLVILACIHLVVLSGAHLLVNSAGHMTLGLAAWWCAAAYGCGLVLKAGLPPWIAIFAGIVVGAASGALNCLLTLRLTKLSYTLASLAVQQLLLAFLASLQVLGGRLGMTGIPRMSAGMLLLMAVLILVILPVFLVFFKHTRLSRTLYALREDKVASEAVGIHPFRQWLKVYLLAGSLIGLAGSLYAMHMGTVIYASFAIHLSVLLLLAVIVGSPFESFGPLVGAIFLILIPELLLLMPIGVGHPEFLRNGIFAVLAIIILSTKHWKRFNRARPTAQPGVGKHAPPI